MKRIEVPLMATVLLGLASACESPFEALELCSARGDSAGRVHVSCFAHQDDTGRIDEFVSFSQTLEGTSGWVDRWQYGEALHFTDFNDDGLVDLCSARGNTEGHVDVACHERDSGGDFSDDASFTQTVTGLLGWIDDWRYGEALHFTDFNGDGRVDLCAVRGNAEGALDVSCLYRDDRGRFPDAPSFQQILTGKKGWVDRWQYGEALHLVDFNADGRTDLCGARGDDAGRLEVFCFLRNGDGSLPDAPSFEQSFAQGWTNRWRYGEVFHFTDINGDGRLDLCGARGVVSGQLEVGCFFRSGETSLTESATLRQLLSDKDMQWTANWSYGEALHFTR